MGEEILANDERQAKEHIDKIRESYTKDGRVLEALAGAMWIVETTFPRIGHFLLEFFQNAEDAGATEIDATLEETTLKIYNNGGSFSPDDVEPICSVGRSRKDPREYLGYLGVGFKSIFLISSCPHIYSTPYRFKFDKNHWAEPTKIPWQITPIWIDELPREFFERIKTQGTIFSIPLKQEGIQKLREEFENLHPRTLLFLRHLNEIQLAWDGKRKIIRKSILEKRDNYEIHQLEFNYNGKIDITKWLVFRHALQVPEDIRADPVTKEWRSRVEKREIGIAFRLNEQMDLTTEPSGTIAFGIFSHVPTREVEYGGIPFMLHADFLTAPGREEIKYETSWNRWLLEEAVNILIQKIIKIFKIHERWKFSYTNVLITRAKPYMIDRYLLNPIESEIRNGDHFVRHDGSFVRANETIQVSESVVRFLGEESIEKLSGKKILHPDCRPHELLGISNFQLIRDFFRSYPFDFERFKATFRDEWLKYYRQCLRALAEEFLGYSEGYQSQIKYDYLSITSFLDQEQQTCRASDIWIPENAEIENRGAEYFPSKFRFLHPDLRDELILKYLRRLGAQELGRDVLETHMRRDRVPELLKKLADTRIPDDEKVNNVKLLKGWWENGFVGSNDLSGILVKTKTGKWIDPKKVWFSKEFEPEKNIELLLERGILDRKGVVDGDFEFLDPVFIKNETHDRLLTWRKFFEELELGKNFDEDRIAWRIGILTALCYEKEKYGIDSHELHESEARGAGFDIPSRMPDGTTKKIEAKGRSKEYPVTLTKAETKLALEEGNNTFIYITPNALKKPTLYIIRGKALADLATLIALGPNDWKRLAEDTWSPL